MSTKKTIINWVNNFVAVFHPKFGGIPCPFAAAAMKTNRVSFKWTKNLSSLKMTINKLVDMPKDKDVLVYYMKVEMNSLDEVYEFTENYNEWYQNNDIDLFILFDHPERVEYIKGVHMNFSKDTILILIQRHSKLLKAREQLHSENFYDDWDSDAYRRVVIGDKI